MEVFELSKLNGWIRRAIALNFQEPIWITAELVSAKESRGHWYLDLVEKNEFEVLAQNSAVIWSSTSLLLKKQASIDLNSLLRAGHQLKLQVIVDYHVRYGLKLVVQNIDSAFTQGVLAEQKQKIIARLILEKLWQRNKERELPKVVQRIALISSSTAAGKADFEHQLLHNSFSYSYRIDFFSSAMQGDRTEVELVSALEKINRQYNKYDCVVIIRGGGGKMDLADFDSYEIAKKISEMKLPVISGIGHQIDESITDLCSFYSCKTPTAVAEFIHAQNREFETECEELFSAILQESNMLLNQERISLNRIEQDIYSQLQLFGGRTKTNLDMLKLNLNQHILANLSSVTLSLFQIESQVQARDPRTILSQGYTIILQNQNWIKLKQSVDLNSAVHIKFIDGDIQIN
ncbi:MAG TPA: exodeoxyribonuclease VII large subunit [Saprospiraceae bacterium]|nr:exodeoxyribonuclease VII large subunit [Saprospiraceae bacterium]